jgi:hypothetical protein
MQRPDIAGFRDAQQRLRQEFGVDAVFFVPGDSSWPADTPLDPETGKPYDPFLEPEVPGVAQQITVHCSFVHRPLVDVDPDATPLGAADQGSAALIVPLDRYQEVKRATRVTVGEDVWDVQMFRYDVALTVPRWIAYLERA